MLSFTSIMLLFLQGCTSTEEPFLTMLVNNVVLVTTREQLRRGIRSVVYYYGDGDAVDMSCTCEKGVCDVQVDYDYATVLDDAFQSNYSQYGAGFRLELQAVHNNSHMTCKCRDCQNELTVIFIIREKIYNILNLKINGLIVGEVKPKPVKRLNILLRKEAYFENGNVQIECGTNIRNVHIHTTSNKKISSVKNDTYIELKTPLQPLSLTFLVYNQKNKFIKRLELKIKLLHFALLDHPQLIVDVPRNSIEFYNFGGQHIIYYEYEEGHSLNLNCSTSAQVASQSFVTFIKPDEQGLETRQISPSSIFTEMQLSSNDDKRILHCFLKKLTEDSSSTIEETWGQASILLHKKHNIVEVQDKRASIKDMSIITYSATGIAVLIVIIICFFFYRKKRKRSKTSKEPEITTTIEGTERPLSTSPPEDIYHKYEVINYAASIIKSTRISHRYVNTSQVEKTSAKTDKIEPEYCVPFTHTNNIEAEYCDPSYVNTSALEFSLTRKDI